MVFTGRLATNDSVLGRSFQLGVAGIGYTIVDTLSISEVAIATVVHSNFASDILNFTEQVIRVHEKSAYDLVALNDQASGARVRTVYDTLTLTDEAVVEVDVSRTVDEPLSLDDIAEFDAVFQRLAPPDTLELQDTAIVNVVYRRDVYEFLTLTDVVGRIISASDTLGLSDEAAADRILQLNDTLSLSDTATASVVRFVEAGDGLFLTEDLKPGHVTLREVTDILSLGEESVGDRCRVAHDDELVTSLTDEATFERCRFFHDELELEDLATYTIVYKRRVWDTLTLADELHHDKELDAAASDALSLSEAASVAFLALDTLSLADEADAIASRAVYDTFAFSEIASVVRDRRVASDTLALGDQAVRIFTKTVRATDSIQFNERARPGLYHVSAVDVLQRISTDYDPYTYEPIVTYIGLQDVATASTIHAEPKEAEDHLSFAERAVAIRINADAIPASASDSITLTEKVCTCESGVASESVILSDAATVVASKVMSDELDLLDAASYNIDRNNLTASDTVQLSEAILWYNRLEDFLYVYHPFVGTGTGDVPDPPPVELEGPIPGITDPFKLVYPTTWPFSDTLILRAPNLGNRDRLQMNRISRETRGGTLVVFADPIWPKIQTLVLDFSGLTWTEASGLYTFMDAHLGLEIGVLDWEHRFWRGVITKLDDPIVQDGKGCKYSAGFEFEGELATYPGP
jgi:hypothetical protein